MNLKINCALVLLLVLLINIFIYLQKFNHVISMIQYFRGRVLARDLQRINYSLDVSTLIP